MFPLSPPLQPITPPLFQISLGAVNCFVVDTGADGLILIDTGYAGSVPKIFAAITASGRSPQAIRHLLLTHSHPDHAGSAAAIVQQTGARVWMHPADAALVAEGRAGRMPFIVSPGVANWVIFQLFIRRVPNQITPFVVDRRVHDGDVLPLAGGIRVIHTPGHSAGHIALYLPQDDVLIAGDICANMRGPALSVVYEDRALGVQSILKATQTPFGRAVFGHGRPLLHDASTQIRRKFAPTTASH